MSKRGGGCWRSTCRVRETADLLAVLGDAAAAYGAMATAISSGDQPGYDDARAGVYEAEAALWSETGQFGLRPARSPVES